MLSKVSRILHRLWGHHPPYLVHLFCCNSCSVLWKVARVLDGSWSCLEILQCPRFPRQFPFRARLPSPPHLSLGTACAPAKATGTVALRQPPLLPLNLWTRPPGTDLFSLPGELVLQDPVLISQCTKSLWLSSPFHRPRSCSFYLHNYITILLNIFFSFIFWPFHMVCGLLVPQPGIEPMDPLHWKHSLSHWTTRAVPNYPCIIHLDGAQYRAGTEWMDEFWLLYLFLPQFFI